jgi:YD repeat-containing protein
MSLQLSLAAVLLCALSLQHASGAPEFPLPSFQSTETQSPSSANRSIRMSDRQKAELRGPVKMCVYESTMPDSKKLLTKMEYSLDGKLLTTRTVQPDGPEWITSQTYDAEGRLVKTASGKVGEPGTELVHAYDDAGRLLSITDSPEEGNRTDFRYDEQGRKTTVQTFDPKTIQSRKNSMFGGSPWDAAQAGFGVPPGGNVTTIYGENDKPTEAQVHDAEGRIVSRMVRTYDANGRIMEENQIQENPALLMVDKFSAEQRVALDDKQLEAMNKAMKSMLSGRSGTGKTYTYDAQGRVKEVRDRNFVLDTVTTTSYNEHGDKSEERITRTDNTAFPVGVAYSMDEHGTLIPKTVSNTPSLPEPPKLDIIEYRYEYDQYGNWTEQTVVHRSESNEYSAVRNRTLTYY